MNPCLSVIQVYVDRFMQSQSYHNKTSSDWIMTFQPVPHFGYWSPWTWTNEKPVSWPRDHSRPIRGRVQVWHCQCAEIQFGYLARSVVNWPLPPAPRAQGWVSAVFYLRKHVTRMKLTRVKMHQYIWHTKSVSMNTINIINTVRLVSIVTGEEMRLVFGAPGSWAQCRV